LVAAIEDHALVSVSKPSISTSNLVECLLALVVARRPWPAPRWRPTASISSTKMMQGADLLGLLEQVAHAAGADADEHLDKF
jgi:hypothetical protein